MLTIVVSRQKCEGKASHLKLRKLEYLTVWLCRQYEEMGQGTMKEKESSAEGKEQFVVKDLNKLNSFKNQIGNWLKACEYMCRECKREKFSILNELCKEIKWNY